MRRYTGATLATYTLYSQTQAWYTYQGPVGSLVHPDGTTLTSFSYDLARRLISASDPDSGSWSYGYDADGNVTQQTDARGTNVYAAYDGLDRLLWQSAHADGTSPLATDAYDDTTAGNAGVGRLTTEGYASGPNQSVTGTYSHIYDGRGRPTTTSLTIAGPGAPQTTYSVGTSYDDANRPVSLSLPATGDLPTETLTYAYNDGTDGGLASLTSSLTSPTSTLFQQPTYTSQGLLNGWKSGVASGNPAWQAGVSLGYDGDLRVTDSKLTRTDTISGLSLPIAEVQPSYDAIGNVSSVTTTLAAVGSTPGGTETQAFCYDDLDRLTWAGTSGTGPCGRTGSEGISGAGYTASYAYDTFDRLTSASVLNGSGVALPNAGQGTYTYGASGHLHAVSAVGSGTTGYSAAYDTAGDMTCRAVGASTCTNATPTGQTLGYDALRRLISWQNASSNPTATGAYAYDGGGSRIWQQDTSTTGGVTTTTTTTYILGFAEITSTQTGQAAASTTATRFYPLVGGVSALRDAAGLSYVASDQLGTPLATLNLDTGAVLGEQLRAPYGQARYAASAPTNGGMRTTYGFTGQREDASAAGSSGLDYFNARYYDPVVGRFSSADSYILADPLLDNYAYVGNQPTVLVDPSGNAATGKQGFFNQLCQAIVLCARFLGGSDDGRQVQTVNPIAASAPAFSQASGAGAEAPLQPQQLPGMSDAVAVILSGATHPANTVDSFADSPFEDGATTNSTLTGESESALANRAARRGGSTKTWSTLQDTTQPSQTFDPVPLHNGGQYPFVVPTGVQNWIGWQQQIFSPADALPGAFGYPTHPTPGVQRSVEWQTGFAPSSPLPVAGGSPPDVLPGIQRFFDYMSMHGCWGCTIAVLIGAWAIANGVGSSAGNAATSGAQAGSGAPSGGGNGLGGGGENGGGESGGGAGGGGTFCPVDCPI